MRKIARFKCIISIASPFVNKNQIKTEKKLFFKDKSKKWCYTIKTTPSGSYEEDRKRSPLVKQDI